MMPTVNNVNLYNRTGYQIQARDLLDLKTYQLDTQKFEDNKPIYISEYFALNYIANFLALSATFSHVALWYGKNIMRQAKQALKREADTENNDVHNKLMAAYPDVPEWGYLLFLIACIVFMSFIVTYTHYHMPVWAVFMGVGITAITIIPLGVIEAVTGSRIYLNVLSQMIIGLIIPGNTIGVMAYKSLGVNTSLQALTLIQDLKLGHYMKIPPIAMVGCQLYGTFVGSLTTTITSWETMETMKNIIGKGDWKAIGFRTFYNAAAIWGAIGPRRFFGIGTPYETLLLGFLFGLLLPLLPWLGNKFYPSNHWHHINIPIIVYVSGAGGFQNGIISSFIVSYIFQFYIFRYHPDWWKKYNYVLSAAISGGVSICVLVISLLRSLKVDSPVWFGNPDIANDVPIDYYCTSGNYK
jgi:OPT family oligopeptide transporter